MRLGEGGEAYKDIASMGAGLPFCRYELQRIVFYGDDPGWALFRYALSEEEFEVLGLCQRGTSHHPDDELSIVGDGQVSPIAMDRIDGDVGVSGIGPEYDFPSHQR